MQLTKKKIAGTGAAFAVATSALVAGSIAFASDADASYDNPRCISKNEYRRIGHGMTKARIRDIVGSLGVQSYQYNGTYVKSESREFRACYDSWAIVGVDFENNWNGGGTLRVSSKYWY